MSACLGGRAILGSAKGIFWQMGLSKEPLFVRDSRETSEER